MPARPMDQAGVEARIVDSRHGVDKAIGLQLEVPAIDIVRRGKVGEGACALQATMEVQPVAEVHHVDRQHTDA